MSDGGFEQVTKYLDITPATRDRTRNLKPLSITPSRAIRKLRKSFVLPAITGPGIRGALLAVVDYTMPSDFYISKIIPQFEVADVAQVVMLAVRYRVGTTVYRYRLDYTNNSIINDGVNASEGLQAPFYDGQRIAANFVLELWGIFNGFDYNIGPVEYVTSLAVLPTTPDDLSPVDSSLVATPVLRSALVVAFPETLPTPIPAAETWLDNP